VEVLVPRRDRQGLSPAEDDSALEGLLSLHAIGLYGEALRKAGVSLLALGNPQKLPVEGLAYLEHQPTHQKVRGR